MATEWSDVRKTLSPEAEERIRKSVEETARVMREAEAQDEEAKMAALRAAIDSGLASGIAEPGVFSRLRERYGLPDRES